LLEIGDALIHEIPWHGFAAAQNLQRVRLRRSAPFPAGHFDLLMKAK
jgi:hypothetical protein